MNNTINVLLIEDEPLIIGVYERVLIDIASKNDNLNFNVQSATNCDKAILELEKAEGNGQDLWT